ncbi:MAG: hypothetical protein KKD01_10030 [Proteobacteria bacterium]|nr:hypothetical protein [Pseudomonadota bacterium]MBU1234390.1 hypothetical protein [Pseudomonadota bacterium]MBU1418579.1 hypothetical protein [Pseudomonadota bacterium]MBU1455051.1 hypothetical protein [Pseudomonadota bacterium]
MSDNVLAAKAKGLYQILCQDNWGKNTDAILVATVSPACLPPLRDVRHHRQLEGVDVWPVCSPFADAGLYVKRGRS